MDRLIRESEELRQKSEQLNTGIEKLRSKIKKLQYNQPPRNPGPERNGDTGVSSESSLPLSLPPRMSPPVQDNDEFPHVRRRSCSGGAGLLIIRALAYATLGLIGPGPQRKCP